MIYASGDGGVRGGHDSPTQCSNNTFIAVFPASCPFVTSVGSTVNIEPETVINFSGGGFSNYFARPSYQDTAVSQFLSTLPSDFAGIFNSSGRGYPDVSGFLAVRGYRVRDVESVVAGLDARLEL